MCGQCVQERDSGGAGKAREEEEEKEKEERKGRHLRVFGARQSQSQSQRERRRRSQTHLEAHWELIGGHFPFAWKTFEWKIILFAGSNSICSCSSGPLLRADCLSLSLFARQFGFSLESTSH